MTPEQEARAHRAMVAIIEEIERRLLADAENSGILSSVCQNTEDDTTDGRNDHLCARVDRRTGKARL